MSPSLRALLAGILDYAGLFPPARLSLEESVRNYAQYRQGPDAWMLGRFVCPVGRLTELPSIAAEFIRTGEPWPVSVLGRGGDTLDDLGRSTAEDLRAIASFQEQQGVRFSADAFEVRWPGGVADRNEDPIVERGSVRAQIEQLLALAGLTVYFEVPPGGGHDELITLAVPLAAVNRAGGYRRSKPPGLKLRTGGLDPAAIPTAERVAQTIITCRDLHLALKFTAGLHHPIRHFDAALQAPMHGFLNVFGAGVLAHARGLSETQVQAVIEDEDARAFRFDDVGFRWRDLHATVDEIIPARRAAVISFGSCSFDEPRDDLRSLLQAQGEGGA